jgi:hypothetical protein
MGFVILKQDLDKKTMIETTEFEGLAYFKPLNEGPTIFESKDDAEAVMVASQIEWPELRFEITERSEIKQETEQTSE